jgi:RimJ/RimL family protein N-acetyltransferase
VPPVPEFEAVLRAAEDDRFPPADGGLTLLPQPSARDAAVLSFTGHVFVVADVAPQWLAGRLRPGELSEAFTPPFLGALAEHLDRRVNAIDLLALAPDPPPLSDLRLTPVTDVDHPRVRRARRYRTQVRVFATPGGILALGRGLAGRWEVGLEVDEARRGQGLGRTLALAAAGLVPEGRRLWAQIAPGNAASLRAFLAAGYRPVGQEALLVPR